MQKSNSAMEFKRIVSNVRGDEHVDSTDFEQNFAGCDCDSECTSASACLCIRLSGGQRHYDDNGTLLTLLDSSKPIFECFANCACHRSDGRSSCRNRVVQFGDNPKAEIFESKVRGIGRSVRARTRISCGEFVGEYLGEVISRQTAQQRLAQNNEIIGHNYLLTINEFFQGAFHQTYIDARNFGAMARFINHSCEPNLQPQVVRVGAFTPRLALFASRDIESGEELSYDYGFAACQRDISDVTTTRKECRCGTTTCHGFLPSFKGDFTL